MGDEAKEKIKVAFIDQGIDKEVKDFKGVKFHELAKTPDEILQQDTCYHGTAVFGVFYRTLNALVDQYSSQSKSTKDIAEIIDYSFLHGIPSEENTAEENPYDQGDIIPVNQHYYNIQSKISPLVPSALNLSLMFSFADYNIKSAMIDNSNQFKGNRQKGTFVVAGAGNAGNIISVNDIFPQNDLYVFTVGATYPQDEKKPENLLVASSPDFQLGLSTPGTGVVLSTLGRHITYTTQSYPWVTLEDGTDVLKSDIEKCKKLKAVENKTYVLLEDGTYLPKSSFEKCKKSKAENITEVLVEGVTYVLLEDGTDVPKSIFEACKKSKVVESRTLFILEDGTHVLKSDFEKIKKLKACEYIDVSGTSFACPSVIAYKTYAQWYRPDLDLNNIEHLLITSAEEIQTDQLKDDWKTKELSQLMRTVTYNNAQNWNGSGQPVYYEFGLGAVNEDRFIHLVKTWEKQDLVEEEIVLNQPKTTYGGQHYTYTFECNADNEAYVLSLNVENKNVNRQQVDYLSITSPMGTESQIFNKTYSWQSFADYAKTMTGEEKMVSDFPYVGVYLESPINNKLKNTHFYGENIKGKWIVKSNVPLEKAEIVFRSIKNTADDWYRYDDRVLKIAAPSTLMDNDGGKNVIDLSYYKSGRTEVELSEKKREIRFMAPDGKVAKTIPIGEGNFPIIKHAALGGTTIRG